jgi:tripeptidyl-peptidase-1
MGPTVTNHLVIIRVDRFFWVRFLTFSLITSGSAQCGVFQPTNVISFSYGETELGLPKSVVLRQCNEYMKLGMQGISLIFSSGDAGVGWSDGVCTLRVNSTDPNSGPEFELSPDGKIFTPTLGSTCPYVTSVGATFLPTGSKAGQDQEVAVTRFQSGGGFGNYFGIPEYQAGAVGNYLDTFQSNHDPKSYKFYTGQDPADVGANGGVYNRAGRGYPDVAAVGDNFALYISGVPLLIGGTSLSAPVFASMVNLINEQRLAAGKSTVGFLNPLLYAHPEAFNDITVGSNPGCGTNGFAATEGWDPVTGLGTPNFPRLLDIAMQQA